MTPVALRSTTGETAASAAGAATTQPIETIENATAVQSSLLDLFILSIVSVPVPRRQPRCLSRRQPCCLSMRQGALPTICTTGADGAKLTLIVIGLRLVVASVNTYRPTTEDLGARYPETGCAGEVVIDEAGDPLEPATLTMTEFRLARRDPVLVKRTATSTAGPPTSPGPCAFPVIAVIPAVRTLMPLPKDELAPVRTGASVCTAWLATV